MKNFERRLLPLLHLEVIIGSCHSLERANSTRNQTKTTLNTLASQHYEMCCEDCFTCRYLKLGQFNLRARPNVVFDGEDGMDADGLTRELCHMIMATMRDGKGGIILFEGQVDHLIPVHNEQYLASQYFKYAGQLIAYSFIHGGFGMTGLSRAIAEYLKSDDIDKCLQFLSVEDIPDLDVRQKLKQVLHT